MPNKVEIKIDGDAKGAIKSINGVKTALLKTEKQVVRTDTKFRTAFKSMGSALSKYSTQLKFMGIAAITAFAFLIKSAIDTAESLEKMSQRVGVSVEFLSTLRHATELSGTEISVMEKALQRMSRTMFDAERGLLTAKIPFQELGVATAETSGELKNAETIILEVADKFKLMEDGTRKTAIALQIFGRAGADLIPLLNEGAEGIKKMQEEAKILGLEISTHTAKQAAEFKDDMLRLERSVTGVAFAIAKDLLPMLNSLSKGFLGFIKAFKESSQTLSEGLLSPAGVLAFMSIENLYGRIVLSSQSIAENANLTLVSTYKTVNQLKIYNTYGALAKSEMERIAKILGKLEGPWERVSKILKRDIILMGLTPMGVK